LCSSSIKIHSFEDENENENDYDETFKNLF